MYKIILTGKRNFEINVRDILDTVINDRILKIKDNTKINYDLDTISREDTLKGIFIREALKLLETKEYTREEIEKAIEIGLEAM